MRRDRRGARAEEAAVLMMGEVEEQEQGGWRRGGLLEGVYDILPSLLQVISAQTGVLEGSYEALARVGTSFQDGI